MAEFAWNGDDADAIVLGWQPRTAVYGTKDSGIMIRQECDGFVDDEDDMILLTPLGALQVAWRIIELAHEIGLPKPNKKAMAKSIDFGPSEPPPSKSGPRHDGSIPILEDGDTITSDGVRPGVFEAMQGAAE